jgi:hypothetical protein
MNLLKKFSLFLFISIGLIACTEDESVEPLIDDLSSTETFFKAKFNGSNFNSTQTTASIVNNKLVMVASQGGNSFTIEIENILERTYNPNDVGVKIEYRPAGSGFAYIGKNPDVTSTGLINIRKIDYLNKKISATFNFTGYWSNPNEIRSSINFTNGIFNNITFESNIIPPPPSDQVFTCNFDGQTFIADLFECYIVDNKLIMNAKKSSTNDVFSIYFDNFNNVPTSINLNILVTNTSDPFALINYTPNASNDFGYISSHPTDPDVVTGQLNITNIDLINKKISGTFNYTGYWSDEDNPLAPKQFSNGVFNDIVFSEELPVDHIFNCKINNTFYDDFLVGVGVVEIGNQSYISISAIKSFNRFDIQINNNLDVGTYQINYTGTAVKGIFSVTNINYMLPIINTGTLTITEKTADRIKGNFSFNTPQNDQGGPYNITEGIFDVELP